MATLYNYNKSTFAFARYDLILENYIRKYGVSCNSDLKKLILNFSNNFINKNTIMFLVKKRCIYSANILRSKNNFYCNNCYKNISKVFRCKYCKQTFYCSTTCMIEDCDAHMSLCNDIAKEFAFIKNIFKKSITITTFKSDKEESMSLP